MEGNPNIPVPFEWIVSRICEEFHCLPSEAKKELLDDPSQMALDILELRAYARAKKVLDNAKRSEDVPDSPMIDRVFLIQHEILKRKKAGKTGGDAR